ncbi:hypothetical protein COHA_000427 [Chlorella ohadii]|uniref:Small ribosomal subunit protein uS9c n=1 Tax=Chlorella ohadii TaxID=2649997 RepID=A0AAD5E0P5_9CHLO|nr:hypothetical protein COHA_000427 [Chlorella ohadii]
MAESVQTFGRKKNAVAVAYVKRGKGEIRLNGAPLELVQPETLRWKAFEPVLLLGKQRFSNVDIRIRVKGGGQVSQIYAIRQAISKGIVAFYQKYVDEQSKNEIKDILLTYDRTLLVADPRRCEPKKVRAGSVATVPARGFRNLTGASHFSAVFWPVWAWGGSWAEVLAQ